MNFLPSTSICIVLVNTSHPGNIGAAARAIKNMGLSKLMLVNPKIFPHADATARASGADDILAQAVVVNDLDEAIKDCKLVIGTTARSRGIPWPLLSVRAAAEKILQEAIHHVAVLFGHERSGLTNDELDRCHFVINIPCNPDYSSLNLAAAVQIITYEIRMAYLQQYPEQQADDQQKQLIETLPFYDYASADEMQKFYQHLEETLVKLEFLDPENPRKLMRRLIRLYNRARVEKRELNILRGILTAVQARIGGQ